MSGVYAVIGGTDGVGTTTTAAALGASLAERTRHVAVIDGDRDDPSLATALDVTVDGATVETALRGRAPLLDATYRASRNLDVVPGDGSDDGSGTRLGAAADLVAAARERYDVVLIDVGAGENVETALWAALADRALFVSTPDDDALAGVETGRHAVEYLGTPVEGVVLNRVRADGRPDADAVADRVDAPVVAVLPYDEAAVESAAVGTPVIDHDPESQVAAGYWQLADRLGDDDLADDPVVPAVLAGRTANDPGADNEAETAADESGTDSEAETTADESGTDSEAETTADEDTAGTDGGFDWVAESESDSDTSAGPNEAPNADPGRNGDEASTEEEEAVAAAFKERMDRVREQRESELEPEGGDHGERQGLLNRLFD